MNSFQLVAFVVSKSDEFPPRITLHAVFECFQQISIKLSQAVHLEGCDPSRRVPLASLWPANNQQVVWLAVVQTSSGPSPLIYPFLLLHINIQSIRGTSGENTK